MITYEQKDITLTSKDGPQTITAQVASNGLAYHRTLVAPLDEMVANPMPEDRMFHDRMSRCWTITHVASGNSICWETCTFDNERQCKDFISKVDGMVDWTAPQPKASMKTKREIQRIAHNLQTFEITYL